MSTTTFDEFYLGTRGNLLRRLTAMTADPQLAEDVLQEAYARAWQRWSRVSRLDDPQAWVRTVGWRLAVSAFRRAALARRLGVAPDEAAAAAPAGEALDLRTALRRLHPHQREALVLHLVYGYSLTDIARETGVATGTVKSRLARGRAALATILGPDYHLTATTRAEELT